MAKILLMSMNLNQGNFTLMIGFFVFGLLVWNMFVQASHIHTTVPAVFTLIDSKEIWDKKKNYVFHIYKLNWWLLWWKMWSFLKTKPTLNSSNNCVLEAYVNYNIRLSTETLLYFSLFHVFLVYLKMGSLREWGTLAFVPFNKTRCLKVWCPASQWPMQVLRISVYATGFKHVAWFPYKCNVYMWKLTQ